MLWHVVTMDLAHLDGPARDRLESEVAGLEKIKEILWFRLRRDVERPGNTTFITVMADREALARYRGDPIHVAVAESMRAAKAIVTRLDLDDLPTPS
jgi:hypothetical protein